MEIFDELKKEIKNICLIKLESSFGFLGFLQEQICTVFLVSWQSDFAKSLE